MTETVGSHLITRVFGTSCIRGALRLISVMYILNLKPYRGAHFAEWLSIVSCVVSDVSHAIRFCYNRVIRRVCCLERIKYERVTEGSSNEQVQMQAEKINETKFVGLFLFPIQQTICSLYLKRKEEKKIDVYIWRTILSDMREAFLIFLEINFISPFIFVPNVC